MKLIKEIDSKRDRNGVLIKWGKFLCEFCFKEVEMKLGDGMVRYKNRRMK